jgi:hypothetical protein
MSQPVQRYADVFILHWLSDRRLETHGPIPLVSHHLIDEILLILLRVSILLQQIRANLRSRVPKRRHVERRYCNLQRRPSLQIKSLRLEDVRCRRHDNPRTGPPLVRKPGHHEMVGRPLAKLKFRRLHQLLLPVKNQRQNHHPKIRLELRVVQHPQGLGLLRRPDDDDSPY